MGQIEQQVATPHIDVTEVVGAGDAFAAGFLAAELRGLDPAQALMIGHLAAGEAIKTTADVPVMPPLKTLREKASRIWSDVAPTHSENLFTASLQRN